MDEPGCDVAIVGGGLVGLSLAFEMADRGAMVTLIDAGFPGRATDAGAGILSPDTSADPDPAAFALASAAGVHYPDLLARLARAGIDVAASSYDNCGLLSVGLRPHEDTWFAPFAEMVTARSPEVVSEITPAAAQHSFPPLGSIDRALHCTSAARVDGRGMAEVLRRGVSALGVRMVTGVVRGVVAHTANSTVRTVQRIEVEGEPDVICGAVAVTGGAWSADMGDWLGCPLPIAPVKGQIVHLGVSGPSAEWPIVQPLMTHYIVPWPGGRVACGGTFEVGAGFDPTVTAVGLQELLRECLIVAPGLAQAQYLHTRVGLRPVSADDRPVVGRVPGWHNAWVVTGHGAGGLLLGPYSAALVAGLINGEDAKVWSALSPDRFCAA
jgi:D-amino-acid dehydrogenase